MFPVSHHQNGPRMWDAVSSWPLTGGFIRKAGQLETHKLQIDSYS